MFERVIVPLDGSKLSETALPYATEVARRFSASLTLVRAFKGNPGSAHELGVIESTPIAADMVTPGVITEAREPEYEEARRERDYLDALAIDLRTHGIAVETQLIDDDPTDAILAVAEQKPASLIVMSTHGRGGLGRLVFGSVAQSVLHRSTVPVMLIRTQEGH